MDTVQRWSPTYGVERLMDEVEHLVTEGFGRARMFPRRHGFRPAFDLYDTGTAFVVKAVVPGAKPTDIDLTIDKNVLTFQGRYGYVLSEDEVQHVTWYQREIVPYQFAETITLPVPVETEEVTATFADGILTLTLPKVAEARSKRIPILGSSILAG